MPGSYRAEGLVLRRTKLGETDLIVTLLCGGEEAVQVRAVAKGARKPGARLAGVVDLGNEVSLLLHRGRTLDTITEGRLVVSRASYAGEIERSAMAAAVLDTAAELTVEGAHDARLYPLTVAALDALAPVSAERLGLVVAAYVLKAAAMQGYRPSFDQCVRCGEAVDVAGAAACGERVAFALGEGGVVCPACTDAETGRPVEAVVLAWAQTLLGMRFADLIAMEPVPREGGLGLELLDFARSWIGFYPGVRPRALDFVLGGAMW